MRLLFLGTGTSYGVPMIGCACEVCRSPDPRNKRTRASALIRVGGKAILIDTCTELRAQALRHGIRSVDAILYTHSHADHVHGVDDVRSFCKLRQAPVPAYGDEHTVTRIKQGYPYIFADADFSLGWGIPRLELQVIKKPTIIAGALVVPVPIFHGAWTILGYRIGGLAYLTDCSGIPDESLPLLADLDTLVLGALRQQPHPAHFSLAEALDMTARLRPRRTYFTHLSHSLDHAVTDAALPDGVHLAYDGLEVEVPA